MKHNLLGTSHSFKWIFIPSTMAVFLFYFFYSINSGITITNDGSHFALFDSLVTTGSPEIKRVRQFAFGDSAEFEGKYFSDRNPGLALFSYVFYQTTRVLEGNTKPLNLDPKFSRNYSEEQKVRIRLVMLVPAIFGALAFLGLIALLREMDVGYLSTIIVSSALLFGTIMLRYATVFYSHIFAACLLVFGLLLVFSYRRKNSINLLTLGIFLLSFAVITEHLIVVVFLPVFAYLIAQKSADLVRPISLAKLSLAGIVPMLALMIYNWICFDSPFSIAHFHHASDAQNHELGTLLRFDHTLSAAKNLLFGAPKSVVGRQDMVGLFSSSPFLYFVLLFPLLAILGYRQVTLEHWVLAVSILLLILGGASVFAPYGGWDRDYRYFLVAIPLFGPFLGSVLDVLFEKNNEWMGRCIKYLALFGFSALCILSLRDQLAHIRHPGQIQYTHLLVNYDAAIVNVSLFFGFMVVTFLMSLILFRFFGHLRTGA